MATEFDPLKFHDDMVRHKLIIPVGVPGIFGRGAVFEDVLSKVNDLISRIAKNDGAEVMAFPPAISRHTFEKTGFLDSFPNLAGTVFSFFGKDAQHKELSAKLAAGEAWADTQGMTDCVLNPAACYPVYPSFTGTIPENGRLVDMQNWVFRHEPSPEPTRMQAFRVREFVRVGTPEMVVDWRNMWLQRGLDMLLSLGLPAKSEVAADPFFGRGGRMLAVSQKEQQLKFEVVIPVISEEKPTACCSFNYHQDKFGKTFDIKTSTGDVAQTACLGFGMERICMALFKTHGFVPSEWPKNVREKLWGGLRNTVKRASVWNLDPAKYVRHFTHSDQAAWLEKNCYVDVWIEALHAQGLDPMAMLPFTVAVDFEGDQWTFFKPPHGDLRTLYGVDTQELNVWRSLLQHAVHHVGEGKLVFTEADAWWLPDTQGTDYRTQHTKSTIVIETIDVDAKKLGYFHNAGYFALEGEDFAKLFRLEQLAKGPDPEYMPFFAEVVRVDRAVKLEPKELVRRSTKILAECLGRRPTTNPMTRFKEQFVKDVEWLKGEGLALYHAYAFATIRQCGANFELASQYVKWLEQHGETGASQARSLGQAAADFESISTSAKAMILKTARAVNSKKVVDFAPMLDAMAASWDSAMAILDAKYRA